MNGHVYVCVISLMLIVVIVYIQFGVLEQYIELALINYSRSYSQVCK